jgi:anti-sigma regulatory factor (Ser/Thr protein kinase)
VYVAPGATHTINRVLLTRLEAGAEARREIVALPISHGARAQLALLVSELVNNAVLHAGAAAESRVSLKVRSRSGRVRVEVSDGGSGFDAPASINPDPLTVGGQGLLIVAALSDAWGVLRGTNGCTVWCEVLVEEPAPTVGGQRDIPAMTRARSSARPDLTGADADFPMMAVVSGACRAC